MTALRPILATTLLTTLVFGASACADDPDAAPDVVGTWREVVHASDNPIAEADRDRMTFSADGSLTQIIDGAPQTAPYTLDGSLLSFSLSEPNETLAITTPIAASADRLVLGAASPVGAVDGVVGTWHLGGTVSGRNLDRTFTLAAGGAMTLDEVDPQTGEPMHFTGTWATSAPDQYELLIMPSPNFTIHIDLFALDGTLGGAMFERL